MYSCCVFIAVLCACLLYYCAIVLDCYFSVTVLYCFIGTCFIIARTSPLSEFLCFLSLFDCCVFVLMISMCVFGVLQHYKPHYSVNLCVCVFIVLTCVHSYFLFYCCVFMLISMCVFGVFNAMDLTTQ